MGSRINAALSPGTLFGWNGRYGAWLDSESGLLLCGARYYAPSLGRFVSRDLSGWTCGPNLHAYCIDDPIDFYDSNGLNPEGVGNTLDNPTSNFINNNVRPISNFCESGTAWADSHGLAPISLHLRAGNMIPGMIVGLHDSAAEYGYVSGLYDGGKASGGEVVWAGTKFGFNLGTTALAIYGAGSALRVPAGPPIVLNIAGEGEIPGAINVNHPSMTRATPLSRDGTKTIGDMMDQGERFVLADNKALPFRTNSIDVVHTKNVPIDVESKVGGAYPQSSEIWRILKSTGTWFRDGVPQTRP